LDAGPGLGGGGPYTAQCEVRFRARLLVPLIAVREDDGEAVEKKRPSLRLFAMVIYVADHVCNVRFASSLPNRHFQLILH